MSSDKFQCLANSILNNKTVNENRNVRYDRNIIDQTLLQESLKFTSLDRNNVNLKGHKSESTDEVDIRIKKFNELQAQFKKFTKNMRKQFNSSDRRCDAHQQTDPMEVSVLLEKLKEEPKSVPDSESVLKKDETVIQQHKSNIEKVNKLMEAVKGYNHVESDLAAAKVVNDSIMLLREVI